MGRNGVLDAKGKRVSNNQNHLEVVDFATGAAIGSALAGTAAVGVVVGGVALVVVGVGAVCGSIAD